MEAHALTKQGILSRSAISAVMAMFHLTEADAEIDWFIPPTTCRLCGRDSGSDYCGQTCRDDHALFVRALRKAE